MKLRIIAVCVALIAALAGFSQAKKPKLMVVPSDAWCKEHGFMQTFDNQGLTE